MKTNEDYADYDRVMIANVEHEALENITDVTLCARFYTNNKDQNLLHEDTCYARRNKNISDIQNKQKNEIELLESERDMLVEYYFEHCPSDYETKYRQKSIVVDVRVVLANYLCSAAFKQVGESLENTSNSSKIAGIVGYTIVAVGLLGALLSLSVFCRPSFLEQHHIGYMCIGRSVFDVFMLVYCTLLLHYRDDENDISIGVPSGSQDAIGAKGILDCCAFFVLFMPSEIGAVLLTAALSTQRMIAVAMPFKAKVYLNSSVAKKICAAVICVCVLVPAICFVVLFTGSNDPNRMCALFSINIDIVFYFSLVWSAVFVVLPWIVIVTMTSLTACHLVAARKTRARMATANQNAASQIELHKQNLIMVFLIIGTFLVALVPEILLNVVAIMQPHLDMIETSINIEVWTYVILALKSSPNFFICFGSNPQFRQIILGYLKRNGE